MNAPRAHYVANAGAKIQLFSGITTTLYKKDYTPPSLMATNEISSQKTQSIQRVLYT